MTFANADFGALEALWRRFFPAKYAVDADLIRWNSVDCPMFDWGASRIQERNGEVVGFVIVKKSPSPTYFRGQEPDQAHITAIAFDDPVAAVDMLAAVKRTLRNRGVFRLVFGADCRHFFPGCPEECGNLRDFLDVEGFEPTAPSFDLERDMRSYEVPAGMLGDRPGVELRRLSLEDIPALDSFLEREFPGRWHYDTAVKINTEERADFIIGLFVDGRLEGFAVTQDSTHRVPVAGAVWREALGKN